MWLVAKYKFVFFLLLFVAFQTVAQQRYRLKAEFTTKEKRPDGKSYLGKGTVYFDKNIHKLVYINTFPENDVHVFMDTISYRLLNNKVVESGPNFIPIDFTVFSMSLNNNLAQFGLSEKLFTLEKVEKKDSLVISTWTPNFADAKKKFKFIVSTKNKKLFGVVIMNPEGVVTMKQFYRKYQLVKGVDFPTEIVQVSYKDGKEFYQVNTYKNIKIDELSENNFYNYFIPAK